MKRLLLAVFTILICTNLSSQEFRVVKGGVTDSLPIAAGISDTYALYTPSDYSPEKKWPVIFVFDPKGRGATTANLFRAAAEDQKYLIASSNINLKSKPIDTIISTARSMMNEVLNSFPIDPAMVYTAGMGEGAQVGSALPLLYKQMAGVMAIGNSFVNPDYLDKKNPYMFIGIVGNKDYMVYEMESYLRFYDDINFTTDIYYFDGKEDEWPGSSVISNAISGFTIEAIKKGLRTKDQDFIQKLYENEVAYTETLRRTRNYFTASQKLDRMEEKYEDFGFEDDIKERVKAIKKTDGFKSQRRDFREATSFEKEQQAEYEYLLINDIMTVNFQNIGWWAYQVDELQKLKDSSNDVKANTAYRLHGYLDFVSKREFDNILKADVPIDTKIFISVLRTAINKNDPEAYFKIISLAGSDGDYESALLYLEDLLKTGYSDMESLYSIDGALDLQFSSEYNQIVKKYLGESKFYSDNVEEN
ncbi:hypothetical protein [Christiangramia forsetii]|uniref:Secreted protein n=2 Tax=Christiangramia forsetii TaxID=411153 RepID=A0LYM6_CHRFK|nr:hypothetical protein [Christiangramia forsetii]GGG33805.1 hypothetical protein GCM10011532_16860 [Christiangramia forsetii]CAL65471.1 secreted protein [Christiangramia forsetii KT0803]